MQNYNFFGKKAIDYKEKLYLCNVFPWRHKSFYCSISLPNRDLERDFMSKTKSVLELRVIAQSPTITDLGVVAGPVESMDRGLRFLYAHTDSASPYQTLMREL